MIIIAGPTSSGKTSLAIELCKKFNGEIISADSRQIFKHMDIGTGKLPLDQKGVSIKKGDKHWIVDGIKIWMYDIVAPNEYYSVDNYRQDAYILISDIKKRGKKVFLVGGTGLYIDTIMGFKRSASVPPNWNLRNELKIKSSQELRDLIPQYILHTMNQSDRNNPRRLIRKIEIERCKIKPAIKENFEGIKSDDFKINYRELTHAVCCNTRFASFHSFNPAILRSGYFACIIIVLNPPRGELYKRADTWVEIVWDPLIKETEDLIKNGYVDTPPLKGIIYKTAIEFIDKKITREHGIERIKYDLHGYIRRQQTWFKKYV